MNIDTANRIDLENEILMNDDLYNYIQKNVTSVEDWAISATTENLRKLVRNFVLDNDETYQF